MKYLMLLMLVVLSGCDPRECPPKPREPSQAERIEALEGRLNRVLGAINDLQLRTGELHIKPPSYGVCGADCITFSNQQETVISLAEAIRKILQHEGLELREIAATPSGVVVTPKNAPPPDLQFACPLNQVCEVSGGTNHLKSTTRIKP